MNQQELIDDYLDGKLSPEDRKLFETLLEDNPDYKIQVEKQKKLKGAGPRTEASSTSDIPGKFGFSPSRANLRSWLISTGIAILVVLVGHFLWITLSMSPGEKLYSKYYETFPSELAISESDQIMPKLLVEAFKAYDQRNFQKAAELLGKAKTQPDTDYALLYLGICHLELGRPEKAIPVLNLIPSNSATASKELASWYEALGYFKLNMLEKGKKPLQITASKSNPYQNQAIEILETLK